MYLSKDQILGIDDSEYTEIPVPEWPICRETPSGFLPVLFDDETNSELGVLEEGQKIPEGKHLEPGIIRIGTISAAEKSKYGMDAFNFDANGKRSINYDKLPAMDRRLIAACVVDQNNKLLFSEDDVDALGKRNANVIERIAEGCRNHNGMEIKKKDGETVLDEIEGN